MGKTSYFERNEAVVDCDGVGDALVAADGGGDAEEGDDWTKKKDAKEAEEVGEERPSPRADRVESLCFERRKTKKTTRLSASKVRRKRSNWRNRVDFAARPVVGVATVD
mgnify:CR=1 FL=1